MIGILKQTTTLIILKSWLELSHMNVFYKSMFLWFCCAIVSNIDFILVSKAED